jgi:hypothetical protein
MTSDPLVVSHTLSLSAQDIGPVVAALEAEPGIADVHADKGGHLTVTYDLRHLRLDDIETIAAKAGATPAGGLFNSLRRGWIKFTDDNIASNVSAPVSPCCNRPPGEK